MRSFLFPVLYDLAEMQSFKRQNETVFKAAKRLPALQRLKIRVLVSGFEAKG